MEKESRYGILESLESVYEKSKGSHLNPKLFDLLKPELDLISKKFKISTGEGFILALIFAITCQGDSADMKDLTQHLGCSAIRMLRYSEAVDQLVARGLVRKSKAVRSFSSNPFKNQEMRVNDKVIQAIVNGRPLPEIEAEAVKDVFDLLGDLAQLSETREEEGISTVEFSIVVKSLMEENKHYPLISKVLEFQFSPLDNFLFLFLVWRTLSGCRSIDISRTVDNMIDNPSRRVRYMQEIIMLKNDLIRLDLIELVEASFFNDTEMKLSEKSLKMLQEIGINLLVKKGNVRNAILPRDIKPKELVFNATESRQLDLVKNLLEEKNLLDMRIRLAEKNLPQGVSILLYGAPGTGKTESAYQWARETGRDILKVELSESKSMWFGESEKIIKRIFTDYRSYAADSTTMPILLFNEADGILSRRTAGGASNVAQTENAMQNIILEELEKFDGIFIATTNLVGNLDSAFDRRFLFKIEFQKPDAAARAKIWKLKLPGLTRRDCERLSGLFEFSGGQIDNIVRKAEIHGIVYGKKPGIAQLEEFCNAELLNKRGVRPVMGFRKS